MLRLSRYIPLALSLAVTFVILPFRTPECAAAERKPLRAGCAAVDITPKEFPLNMPGGRSVNMAHGAHDPLHARALVLEDGVTTLAMMVIDSLGAGPETLDEAKADASKRCGIPVENMLISSTHTHSGPSSNGQEGPAAAYRKIFVKGIADAIVQAHAALEPASIGSAAHPLPEEVFNRRWFLKAGAMPLNPYGKFDEVKMNPGTDPAILDRPAGPTDPDVSIISVLDAKGRKPIAVFANYALHYVGGAPGGLMSADYFGEFARVMPSRVRGHEKFVAMMSNGASGDINNIPFGVGRPPREPFEQIRIVAQKAADAAWTARNKIAKHETDVQLGMLERPITLKLRKPTEEQLAAAKAVLAIKDKDKLAALPKHAEQYARGAVAAAEGESTLTVKIQAIRIGDLAVCCIPFETFCEIGLELKDKSPLKQTIVVGLANGRHGYLPTPQQHRWGGYETWLGTNKVQEDTSVILVKNLLEMLDELKSAE
ncbi:MAG: hypothetical protein C0483_14725 [Pirellula sp.]|nr:hypothetical protein [Pirellula sp.]